MQQSSDIGWDAEPPADDTPAGEPSVTENSDAANEDGRQQYRRWISKAPAPMRRRGGVDPSLYTWKGYRNWAKQVKRNWSSDG